MTPYKQRLYDAYVSSGQAAHITTLTDSPDALFKGSKPYADLVIQPLLPADKSASILDLGCGNGCFMYFLNQYGYHNLIGVDTSSEQVSMAHQLGIADVRQDDIHHFLGTLTEPVDMILLMDVLEHLDRQTCFTLLDQVFACLKPGGKLLVHVPNAEGIFGMRIRYGDLTHEQSFTPTSIRQLLNTVGFSNFYCREDKPLIYNIFSFFRRIIWALGTLPFRLLLMAETGLSGAVLSQNMLVVATK